MSLHEALAVAVRSDPGVVRSHNEDAVFADAELGIAILADGMGGYNAGEVASGMATTLLSTSFSRLLRGPAEDSGVRAWLTSKFRVDIKECDGTWCEVVATSHAAGSNPQAFDGYIHQAELWGVYKDEKFD